MTKTTRMKSVHFKERREHIKALIERVGIWNIPTHQSLADKFNCHRNMIENDIAVVMSEVPQEDIEKSRTELLGALKQAIAVARRRLFSKNEMISLGAANSIAKLADQYTTTLERYGLKEKVADKHIVLGLSARLEKPLTDDQRERLLEIAQFDNSSGFSREINEKELV